MKSGEGISKGVGACEEALQRLLDGKPFVPEHVGLDLSKLTASIVSLEAGFDRGYLKKSRKVHLSILAKIEACRAEADKGSGPSNGKSIKRLEDKVVLLEKELAMVSSQRDRVLTQNLQLWERVRELELAERQNKSRQVRLHH
ncbi:hypothetical protein M0M42_17770 [Pseudomonas knackmussii]|uniref:KfrA N-terminal DNA-binding domain-containing protein n=1 Tax=Pseudomonas knackmussii TaxID=65741 RepID=A0ABY4KS84_9PSED|nr:hypothetical protein [Pseudomonas knackmussii]UPQ82225.1 hypothetical protein M0M42_17770 [Pseudomonas knackmussii]